jgi:hypothetical protein
VDKSWGSGVPAVRCHPRSANRYGLRAGPVEAGMSDYCLRSDCSLDKERDVQNCIQTIIMVYDLDFAELESY